MKYNFRRKRVIKIVWIILSVLMIFSMVFFTIAPMFS